MFKKIIALFIVLFVILAINVQAQTFRKQFTISNASGTHTVEPVYNAVATGQSLEAIVFGFNSATVTIRYVIGSVTNTAGTKIVTATDKTWFATTNMPSLFKTDTVLITAGITDTNANNYVVGDEF